MNDFVLTGPFAQPSAVQAPATQHTGGSSHWPSAGGEMGERIRSYNWAETPLGPIEAWPQSLRILVDLMLGSQQAVYIAWGAELTSLYNDHYLSILGIKHPDMLGKPYKEVWPEILDECRPIIAAARAGEVQQFIDRPIALAGRPGRPMSWFSFSWTPIRDETGSVAGFYCTATETTERFLTEDARRESEERLRQVQEAARIGSFEFDRTTGKAIASPEYLELYGLPDNLSGLFSYDDWMALVHPEDRQRIETETQAAVADPAHNQLDYEFRILRADNGEMRWITARIKLLRDAKGRFVRSLGAQWDITAEKDAQAALRESEERYRSFIAHSSEGIWLLEFDPPLDTSLPVDEQIDLAYRNGHFVECNDAMAAMYGFSRAEDLIGNTLEFSLPSSDPEARAFLADIILSGYNMMGVESVELDADGNRKHFDNSMTGIIEDGQLKRLWGIQRDITDRKQAEEQRTLLIHELNHRVKNTLATVQSIASQTLRNALTMSDAKEALEGRLIALARAHDVLTRESWEGAELKEIVAEAVAPYASRGESRLYVRGPEIRLSPRMALAMAMALQELATNAVKYGALANATGEIRITWDLEPAQPSPRLLLRWEESGGPAVRPPSRRGFGSRLIERSLSQELNGAAHIEFRPTGIVCTVDAPLG